MDKNKMIQEDYLNKKFQNDDVNIYIKNLENYIRDLNTFLPVPLCLINSKNKIVGINTSLTDITGYSQNEIIGKKIKILFRKEEEINNIIKKTANKGYIKYHETILITKDKKEFPIVITTKLRKDSDGIKIGYYIVFINTSEFKKKEETLKEKITYLEEDEIAMLEMMKELHETRGKLKKFNENLEVMVKERTKEIEKLLRQKDEFINQLGHDLKSPLTPLIGLLPVLETIDDDEKSKEIVNIFRRNIEYMRNLVLKTLELAQLNAPSTSFNLKEIKIWAVADSCIKDQQVVFNEKGVKVENKIDKNITVEADMLRLGEVFRNLISNAYKYSPNDTDIVIDAQSNSKFVTISIKDSGRGMTKQQIDHIFEEFYKGDKSRHELSSTGLGLSICNRIIERHGGKIWAESPGPDKGSTFYFTLKKGKQKMKESEKEQKIRTLKLPSDKIIEKEVIH
jgi:PAS domain S-box-containing protein